jgi:hypothetical protein
MNSFGIALASILMVLLNIAIGWAIGARHRGRAARAAPQPQGARALQEFPSAYGVGRFTDHAQTASTAAKEIVVGSPSGNDSASSESLPT